MYACTVPWAEVPDWVRMRKTEFNPPWFLTNSCFSGLMDPALKRWAIITRAEVHQDEVFSWQLRVPNHTRSRELACLQQAQYCYRDNTAGAFACLRTTPASQLAFCFEAISTLSKCCCFPQTVSVYVSPCLALPCTVIDGWTFQSFALPDVQYFNNWVPHSTGNHTG